VLYDLKKQHERVCLEYTGMVAHRDSLLAERDLALAHIQRIQLK
jgi:hypothetical protein